MRIRGATKRDFDSINRLLEESELTLDYKHLQQIVVIADDKDDIVAVGTLVTVLEAAFITDSKYSRKERVIALQALMNQADKEVKTLGYKRFYAFSGPKIIKILKRKFGFLYAKGVNMVKWAEGESNG